MVINCFLNIYIHLRYSLTITWLDCFLLPLQIKATALHYAAHGGHTNIAKCLLDNRAEVNHLDIKVF